MKAHHIMTYHVITIGPDATLAEAARLMLANHFSGLPVVDTKGELVGIVTERDFLRRQELNTQRKRPRWLEFILGPGRMAEEYVKTAGRKVREVMTRNLYTAAEETSLADIVLLMERHHIKRVPVMRGKMIVGMISRQKFRAGYVEFVAGHARSDAGRYRSSSPDPCDHRGSPLGPNRDQCDRPEWRRRSMRRYHRRARSSGYHSCDGKRPRCRTGPRSPGMG